MSLQGSLETFALQEVLRLLASSHKTGELQVKTKRTTGRLWVKDGVLVGGSVGDTTSTVDAVFALLRSAEGTFSFVPDRPPATPNEPLDVETVLLEVELRLEEWRAIEAVVPSVYCTLSLVREVESDVSFSSDEWAIIALVGTGITVLEIMKNLSLDEFVACKRVKHLVELRVVEVGIPTEDEPLFHEPETDVSFLSEDEVVEESSDEAAPVASLDEAREARDKESEDQEAVARWDEIRKLAKLDEDDAEEELTPEEQERAKELIEAGGAETSDGEPINRGLLLKLLASAQTS